MATPLTFQELLDELARGAEPAVILAYLRAIAVLRGAINAAQLQRLIEAVLKMNGTPSVLDASGAPVPLPVILSPRAITVLDAGLRAVMPDRVVLPPMAPVHLPLRSAVVKAGTATAGSIGPVLEAARATTRTVASTPSFTFRAGAAAPPVPPVPPGGSPALPFEPRGVVLRVEFGVVDPRVIDAVKTSELERFKRFGDDTRAGAKEIIRDGLARGLNPIDTARQVRALMGLTEYETRIVGNFRAELEAGRFGDAMRRALRDRRFDKTLKRLGAAGGQLTPAQIDRMVDAYARRTLNRAAETFARTETLSAMRRGQRLAWEQAIAEGKVDRADLVKTWKTKMDGHQRDEHGAMNNVTVGFDEAFDVEGEGAQQMPGDLSYSCRCVALIRPRAVAEMMAQPRIAA